MGLLVNHFFMRKVPMPPRRRKNPGPALRPVARAQKTTRASEPSRREKLLAVSEMPDVQSPMTVQESSSEARKLEPSKLETQSSAQPGSAALLCGKPPAIRPVPDPSSSSAQAGRLSLPACAEEVLQGARPSERRSLSARQAAEPQVIADRIERNLDKPDFTSPFGEPVARSLVLQRLRGSSSSRKAQTAREPVAG